MRNALKATALSAVILAAAGTAAAACDWDTGYRSTRYYGYGPTYSSYGYAPRYYGYGPGIGVGWYGWGDRWRYRHHRHFYRYGGWR